MDISSNVPPLPKKRGRKPKNQMLNGEKPKPVEKPPPKKRGRKPKGGKIITLSKNLKHYDVTITNIILHLKCSLNDIYTEDTLTLETYNPNIENIESFSLDDNDNYSEICTIEKNDKNLEDNTSSELYNKDFNSEFTTIAEKSNIIDVPVVSDDSISNRKKISSKINKLQHELNIGNYSSKSACFWCTEDFDTPTIYIPKNKS